jgi:hypothetical protein
MPTAERDLIAELQAENARLKARLAELESIKPTPTLDELYPRRPDEVWRGPHAFLV